MTLQQPIWILGGYQTDFARNFTKESLEISGLVQETTLGTLTAAGVGTAQVQVVHLANAMGEFYVRQGHLGSLVVVPEISGVPASRHEAACASGGVAVMAAMADLESGRYDVALVLGVEIERMCPRSSEPGTSPRLPGSDTKAKGRTMFGSVVVRMTRSGSDQS